MAKFKSEADAKSKAKAAEFQQKADVLQKSIMDSAQHIWLAGMGAFNRAQSEGTKLFERLVREGLDIEKRARSTAGDRVETVRAEVETRVGQARGRAADSWDRLEKIFEDRVAGALNRLGVPSSEDLRDLNRRVADLAGELRSRSARSGTKAAPRTSTAKATAKKRPARKSTSKTATTKASAAKSSARKAAPRKSTRKTPAKKAAAKSAASAAK